MKRALDLKKSIGGDTMPYNEEIDAHLKQIVSKSGWKNTDSKKMFGGVCHLLIPIGHL